MRARLVKRAALLLLGIASIHCGFAREPDSCRTVRFADIGWADVSATTGVASVLASGLGYRPSQTLTSVPIAFSGLKAGQIDAFLGYWSPSMDSVIEPFVKAGQVKVLAKANLEGAKYTLAVPDYLAAQGLRSFQDIARFADALKDTLYGIEPGNDGNALIQNMIDKNQFHLGRFHLVESSEAGMLAQLRRMIRKRQPMVLLAWSPHPMNDQFDLVYLSGGDAVFGPDYGAAKVYTVLPPNYQSRCSNFGRLLGNLQFDLAMESQLMKPILDKEDPQKAAAAWLKKHPAPLERWLAGVTTFDGQDGLAAVRRYLGASTAKAAAGATTSFKPPR